MTPILKATGVQVYGMVWLLMASYVSFVAAGSESVPSSVCTSDGECPHSSTSQRLSTPLIGLSRESPARNCSFLKDKPSGLYWLDLDGTGDIEPFQAYCDMETDGGGWTLVYTYEFTNYREFNDGSNAVTPRPKWPINEQIPKDEMTPISVSPPKGDGVSGALDYDLWRLIGNEWLMKSNIMNWISCLPNNGSLVNYKDGHLTCKMVKVLNECKNIPDLIFWKNTGPAMFSGYYGPWYMYAWDSSTTINIPAHDPCGENVPNHLRGVDNPIGHILIR